MENLSDEQLVAAYRKGNEQAFDLLVHRHLKPLYGFVYQFLRNPHDTEDVVQESFLKAWKQLRSFDASKKFKTWLFQIAKNTSFDYCKKKKTIAFSDMDGDAEESFLDTIADYAPLPDQVFESAHLAEHLEKGLEELPLLQRAVLFLYYQGGLIFREIADILDEPLDTVKSRHRRALQTLRIVLDAKL